MHIETHPTSRATLPAPSAAGSCYDFTKRFTTLTRCVEAQGSLAESVKEVRQAVRRPSEEAEYHLVH